jgi:hypothetical protein
MTTSAQLLTVELSDDERKFVWQAMYECRFSVADKPFPYQALGLSSWEQFGELSHRLAHAVSDGDALSALDWVRVLYLTESGWASSVVGAGLDFAIVTEFSDIDALSLLRRLQRKIGRVTRPQVLFPDGGQSHAGG